MVCRSRDVTDSRALPVARRRSPRLRPGEGAAIARAADLVAAGTPGLADTDVFGPRVTCGIGGGTALIFGDAAEIPLLAEVGRSRHDYRLGWLGFSGDVVVFGGPSCPAFEAYQKDVLGQPGLRYLNVDPDTRAPRRATPALCLDDAAAFGALVRSVGGTGDLTLLPHISTATVWALGARLRDATGRDVFIAGPPPGLTRRVNDKLWFGALVAGLLGADAIPAKRAAHNFSTLARHVREFAAGRERLVIKVRDSAGSAGNRVFETSALEGLSPGALYSRLRDALSDLSAGPRFPLAVEVWDMNALASPSVQVWIGLTREGPPVIEGVYRQLLAGEAGAFVGATAEPLPPPLDARLCEGALRLSLVLQRLGYFGRCSFDATASGRSLEDAAVHWIECNGRWGGVSIPMTLLNRLSPDAPVAHIVVQSDAGLPRGTPFEAVRSRCEDLLWNPARGDGIVFLSPNAMEAGTGCQFVAAAPSGTEARRLVRETMERLGVSPQVALDLARR